MSPPVLTAPSVAASRREWGISLLGALRLRHALGVADGAVASHLFFFGIRPPSQVCHTRGDGGGAETAHVAGAPTTTGVVWSDAAHPGAFFRHSRVGSMAQRTRPLALCGEAQGGLTWSASDGCLTLSSWPANSSSQRAPWPPRRLAAGQAPRGQTNWQLPPLHTSAKREAWRGRTRWLNTRWRFHGRSVMWSDSADGGSIASRVHSERRAARSRTHVSCMDLIRQARTRAGYARHGKRRSTP